MVSDVSRRRRLRVLSIFSGREQVGNKEGAWRGKWRVSASALDDDDGDCVLRRSNHLIYVCHLSLALRLGEKKLWFSLVL